MEEAAAEPKKKKKKKSDDDEEGDYDDPDEEDKEIIERLVRKLGLGEGKGALSLWRCSLACQFYHLWVFLVLMVFCLTVCL